MFKFKNKLLIESLILFLSLLTVIILISSVSAENIDNLDLNSVNADNSVKNSLESKGYAAYIDEKQFTMIQQYVINEDYNYIYLSEGTFLNDYIGKPLDNDLNGVYVGSNKIICGVKDKTILDGGNQSRIFTIRGDNVVIENIIFENGNKLNYTGGAVYIDGNNVVLKNCVFRNNCAIGGGALSTNYDGGNIKGSNVTLQNCKFIGNWGSETAGAVELYGNNSKIINCEFISNYAYNSNKPTYGGAVQIGRDEFFIRTDVINSTFKNNYALSGLEDNIETHGGAGCIRDGSNFQNCIFINNTSNQGGALTLHSSSEIINCEFYDNEAYIFGGAVSTGYNIVSMDLSIINSTFERNTAPTGGACQLKGENVKISNSSFKENKVSKEGGAIFIDADNIFISDSVFNENLANINGGAIYINGIKTNISENKFNHNKAVPDVDKLDDGLGGAIFINSTKCNVENNDFYYNTARNGSALYISENSQNCVLNNNVMFENQAWVYLLPIQAKDLFFNESEDISVVIRGGNNIAKYGNLALSNGIYNNAKADTIWIDSQNPVNGANTVSLYQDNCEYNISTNLKVVHEDGTLVYDNTLYSDIYGQIEINLNNLKAGKYTVTATHSEDTYYKGITNTTTFNVVPKLDLALLKSSNDESFNFNDKVTWTVTVSNNGPSDATNVAVKDLLPEGLIYYSSIPSKGVYDEVTGIWQIGNLKVNEVVTIDIVSIVNRTGLINNSAEVNSTEYDYNLENNHDYKDISVASTTDLAITKVVNETNPAYGNIIKWTITVTNNGPDTATGVTVTDLLDKSFVFISSSNDSFDFSKGVWTIGSLTKGEKVSLDIITLVNSTGDFINIAKVKGNELDLNESNNEDNSSVHVNKTADLSVIKYVDNDEPNYHDMIRWTIKVTNNGPDTANNIRVCDVLPEGFIYGAISEGYDLRTNSWHISSLESGKSVEFYVDALVNVTGKFANKVNVTGDEYDPNLSNNFDEEGVSIAPAADLSISKTVSKYDYWVGEEIEYKIDLSNLGPNAAENVIVREILDNGLSLVSCNASTGYYNEETNEWILDYLANGDEESLNLKVIANNSGSFLNSVSAFSSTYDYNLDNNDDEVSVNVTKLFIEEDNSTEHSNITDILTPNIIKMQPTGVPIVILVFLLVFGFVCTGRKGKN